MDYPRDEQCNKVSVDEAIDYPCGLIYKTYPENDSYQLFLRRKGSVGDDIPLIFDESVARP